MLGVRKSCTFLIYTTIYASELPAPVTTTLEINAYTEHTAVPATVITEMARPLDGKRSSPNPIGKLLPKK